MTTATARHALAWTAFLALGLLVTAGALRHHRRTGGSDAARKRLVAITAAGTLALTAVASAMIL